MQTSDPIPEPFSSDEIAQAKALFSTYGNVDAEFLKAKMRLSFQHAAALIAELQRRKLIS